MSNKKAVSMSELFAKLCEGIPAHEMKANLIHAKIAAMIANSRKELGMNQSQFAEYMNVTQSQISKWENGYFNFSVEKLCEIAEKLNLNCEIKLSSAASYNYEGSNVISFSEYQKYGDANSSIVYDTDFEDSRYKKQPMRL